MTAPEVSVVTPVFNGESFLLEAYSSVQQQLGVHAEHIFVDDGSTDSTPAVLSSLSARPSNHPVVVLSQENLGESRSVNNALNIARGDYCVILNADDRLLPGALARLLESIRGTDYGVVYPNYEVIDSCGNVLNRVKTSDYLIELLIGDASCLPSVGTIFRRNLLPPGEFRKPSLRFVSDYEMWLRAALRSDFLHIDHTLAQWRSHPSGTTSRTRITEQANEFVRMLRTFTEENSDHPDVFRLRRQARSMAYFKASMMVREESRGLARRFMMLSLTTLFTRDRKTIRYRRGARTVIGTVLMPTLSLHVRKFLKSRRARPQSADI